MKPLDPTGLKRLHRQWRRRTDVALALVLDDVSTTFNIGTIVRSAAAYGIGHLYITAGTTAPDNPKAGRSAKGSERFVTWSTHADGATAVAAARSDGLSPVAVELTADAIPIFEADLTGPVALVVGHEDRGVSSGALDACDAVVYLPLVGRIGSLNVGVAATSAMAEARRQVWSRPPPTP